jgi:hypothetical protein
MTLNFPISRAPVPVPKYAVTALAIYDLGKRIFISAPWMAKRSVCSVTNLNIPKDKSRHTTILLESVSLIDSQRVTPIHDGRRLGKYCLILYVHDRIIYPSASIIGDRAFTSRETCSTVTVFIRADNFKKVASAKSSVSNHVPVTYI